MFTTPRAISKTIGTAVSTLAVLSLAGNCAFAQPADISKQVDKIFTPLVTSKQIPGVAVAVISGGKVLYKKGYGVTDLSEKSPMTTDAVFDLASVSKQFTATSVLMLAQQGKLSLQDDIAKYLPELKDDDAPKPIRIIDMLHMVSGLASYQNAIDTYQGKTNKDALKAVAELPLSFPTGSKYEYSNTDYSLLAILVSRVAKKPFGTFVKENIFTPCGMESSFVLEKPVECAERVTGYKKEGAKWVEDCDDTPGFVGDGSAFSTIDDLIKYDLALRSGKLLNAESMKVLTTSGKLNNGSLTAYGCGWNVTDDHGHKLTWHDGSWNGTSTYFARFQDKPTSIIVLVNAVEQSADDMGDKVADILFPQE